MKIAKTLLLAAIMLAGAGSAALAQLPATANDVHPLLVGTKVPAVTVQDTDGKQVPTTRIFSKQPTVLVFYRGGWCPYCNRHLSELAETEASLKALGYQVVAISPDAPDKLRATMEKDKLGYRLFSDSEGALTKAMGIAYQVPAHYEKVIREGSDGRNTSFLPVPAVFLLNMEGEILYEYVNPDFRKRISGAMLLANAKALAAAK